MAVSDSANPFFTTSRLSSYGLAEDVGTDERAKVAVSDRVATS